MTEQQMRNLAHAWHQGLLADGLVDPAKVPSEGMLLYGIRGTLAEVWLARRRARKLLASLLDKEQLAEWRSRRSFTVQGSAGGRYRLYPSGGGVHRLERHGGRDFGRATYCLHEPENNLPRADRSVAHLLILSTDEPRFLATANCTSGQLWDGDWLRRLAAARRRRAGQTREVAS